jgi:hypothetical protein
MSQQHLLAANYSTKMYGDSYCSKDRPRQFGPDFPLVTTTIQSQKAFCEKMT